MMFEGGRRGLVLLHLTSALVATIALAAGAVLAWHHPLAAPVALVALVAFVLCCVAFEIGRAHV